MTSSRGRRTLHLLMIVLCAAAVPRPVRAAEDAARREAVKLLREGNRLFEAGDYQAALARYQAAYAEVPSPKLLFNFAQAYRSLGRPVEAMDAYERFLAEAADAPPQMRGEAERARGELAKMLALIEVTVESAGSPVAGAQVSLDGTALGRTPLARPVRVLPGAHQVVVEPAGGGAPIVRRVEVQPDRRATAVVELPAGGTPVSEHRTAATQVPAAGPTRSAAGLNTAPSPTVSTVVETRHTPNHSGRVGLMARADLDYELAGAGPAAAVTFGVGERIELAAGGFLWPAGPATRIPGALVGATVYLLNGRVRPLLAAEAQVYWSSGAHPGAQGRGGATFDLGGHVSVLAAIGIEHVFGALPVRTSATFVVPTIGLAIWF